VPRGQIQTGTHRYGCKRRFRSHGHLSLEKVYVPYRRTVVLHTTVS
jgi:hypothetical protein